MENETTTRPTIKIAGNAIVLTTVLKLDDITELQKFKPEALTITEKDADGDMATRFRVTVGEHADISKYGIVFNDADDKNYATATVLIPTGITNKKEYVTEAMLGITTYLLTIENQALAALEEFKKEKEVVEKLIEEL